MSGLNTFYSMSPSAWQLWFLHSCSDHPGHCQQVGYTAAISPSPGRDKASSHHSCIYLVSMHAISTSSLNLKMHLNYCTYIDSILIQTNSHVHPLSLFLPESLNLGFFFFLPENSVSYSLGLLDASSLGFCFFVCLKTSSFFVLERCCFWVQNLELALAFSTLKNLFIVIWLLLFFLRIQPPPQLLLHEL